MKHIIKVLAVALLIAATVGVAQAGEQGWIGIRYRVETEGLIARAIISATVVAVLPDSPAATSVISLGDQVLEIEGRPIAGERPRVINALMQKRPGEALHMRLKRPSGETYVVVMTASARPE